ncbi:MAG TPA: TolC family protein, partial [Pirellulales bacterium]|nr:TolC family protein [Pirellulales bacterium]
MTILQATDVRAVSAGGAGQRAGNVDVRKRRYLRAVVAVMAVLAAFQAQAQEATIIQKGRIPVLRQHESSLGTMPGAGGNLSGNAPDANRPIIGGAPGATTPNVPPSLSDPNVGGYQNMGGAGIGAIPELPPPELPLFGVLRLPGQEDPGPPGGLTLDAALQRLVATNLDLRSRFLEIPQARADVLTAGLYANPLVFFDTQLIPYGSYGPQRPGGQTQYDLNISHPLDLSHKRRERTRVAALAKKVIEAQYQDAVRVEIANLYEAYVGTLLARDAVRFSKAAFDGLNQVLTTIGEQQAGKIATQADVDSVLIQRELAASSLVDSERAYQNAKVRLGELLAIPPAQAERIELRGSLKVNAPPPPLGARL